MQSRLLINAALLLFITVLGLFIYNSENASNDEETRLSTIKAESITTITIQHNGRTTEITKTNSGWMLTTPVKINANDFRISTLLKLLSTLSYAQYDATTLQLSNYELDPTATSITFNNHKIDFGIINPLNNHRYVKLGNTVHLIDDHHFPLLSSQTGSLVSRTLLPASSTINKLVLPEQTLALNTQDKWTSTKDISTDSIIETLDHWKTAEAFAVHEYFEREPLGSIEVFLDNVYQPVKFFITDVDPWLILARPDIKLEYHFNLESYDSLLRPGADKNLPDELSDQVETVSPEDFMKALNEQAGSNAGTP